LAAVSAKALGLPLVLARKKDKLPGAVFTKTYDTEYSQDSISIKQSSNIGSRPYIVDDILATGGTALAAADLIRTNWNIDECACGIIISLEFLPGRQQLVDHRIHLDTLLNYE
jgi:adenine phosphoribosyltransferase